MAQIVKRAYRFRFHPTNEQVAELSRTFGCARLVYNKALEERTRAYTLEGRKASYVQEAALTAWKKTEDLLFLNEVSSVPPQQVLRNLQTAFTNFFAKRAKYPAFRSRKKSRLSAEYTRSAFEHRGGQIALAKMDVPLDIVWSRPLPEGAQPSTVLEYKTQWYGREPLVVDRFLPSSKLRSACGTIQRSMPLGVRDWVCACGASHDRDVNAAKNILAAGPAER